MGKKTDMIKKLGDKLQNKQEEGDEQQNSKKNKKSRKDRIKEGFQKFNKAQEYEESEEYEELERSLNAMNLKIKPVESDGNCFFRSVADQLEGYENLHNKVRQKVVDYMEKHDEEFKGFVVDEDYKQHCSQMRLDGSWADHLEVHALAQAFNVNVAVYQAYQPVWMIHSKKQAEKTIHLAYEGDLHYDSIRRVDDKLWGQPKTIKLHNNVPTENGNSQADNNKAGEKQASTNTLDSQKTDGEDEQEKIDIHNQQAQAQSHTNNNEMIDQNLCDQEAINIHDIQDQQKNKRHTVTNQPARNKACSCGSNKKYKDCCAKKNPTNVAQQQGYLNANVAQNEQLKVISI